MVVFLGSSDVEGGSVWAAVRDCSFIFLEASGWPCRVCRCRCLQMGPGLGTHVGDGMPPPRADGAPLIVGRFLLCKSRLFYSQHHQLPNTPTAMSRVIEITRPAVLSELLSSSRIVVINCKQRPGIYEANSGC